MMPSMLLLLALFSQPDPISEWNRFEKSVRDQTIQRDEAIRRFPTLVKALKELCRKHPFKQRLSWQFPAQGYGLRDMSAGGFKSKGYNFYDGNHHGGHPAYDIFILDRNQDSLDDRTKKPVMFVAPIDLLILSTETEWQINSLIRGGRYVWAFDPLQNHFFYFAHLNDIDTNPGDFCPAGSPIGTIGRSGKNAQPSRSPTHLHFMVLEIRRNGLVSFDYRSILENGK